MKTPTLIAPPDRRSGGKRSARPQILMGTALFLSAAVLCAAAVVVGQPQWFHFASPPLRAGEVSQDAIRIQVVPGPEGSDGVRFSDADAAETQRFSYQDKSTMLVIVEFQKNAKATVDITPDPKLDLHQSVVYAFQIHRSNGARTSLEVKSDAQRGVIQIRDVPCGEGDRLHIFMAVDNTPKNIEILENEPGLQILSTEVHTR